MSVSYALQGVLSNACVFCPQDEGRNVQIMLSRHFHLSRLSPSPSSSCFDRLSGRSCSAEFGASRSTLCSDGPVDSTAAAALANAEERDQPGARVRTSTPVSVINNVSSEAADQAPSTVATAVVAKEEKTGWSVPDSQDTDWMRIGKCQMVARRTPVVGPAFIPPIFAEVEHWFNRKDLRISVGACSKC